MVYSMPSVIDFFGNSIYAAQALAALYGTFCVILVLRRIVMKRFPSEAAADRFLEEIREPLQRRDFDAVAEICDSPGYWSKAVPQLILVALENRNLPIAKLRRLIGERFEHEILADLEYRMSWVSTVVKAAPMLGLQGTVLGMISAFANISSQKSTGVDPSMLAADISLALWTTAIGLAIAIPLILAGNMVTVRLGKFQDAVQDQLSRFLDDLDAVSDEPGGRA